MTQHLRGRRHDPFVDGLLPCVEKPSRYIDCELNLASAGFVAGGYNLLLVFPDVYEIGMSHQGLQALYRAVAGLEQVGVEFAFAPWPDLEELMRQAALPLRSWQSGAPAGRFDLIGITLPYELHYTNALTIIDLAGIPVEARARGEDDPLVVAGGPCVSNPLPVIGAFDAFFLGDGEDSLREAVAALAALKRRGAPRRERLAALAGIEGVYVEGLSAGARARTTPLRPEDLAPAPVVPAADVVHNRLSIEIMRGCTRGCRFCHAGMTYRPRRERGVGEIAAAAVAGLDASGWEELSLLSLSSSDYSRLEELLAALAPELERRCVSLALPSLRPETVSEGIVTALARVRKSGFTIAPEAGTERLRRVINKATSDEEILGGCRRILSAGWGNLKLYFMIGLPTESAEDLDGIASLIDEILSMPGARGRFRLAVTISPFVPKPHTPFQWERQCSIEEIDEKQRYLQRQIRHRRVELSRRDPRVSALEGVLARGGREVWPAVVDAWRSGCRFDAWRDWQRFDLWERALAGRGLSLESLGDGFDPGRPLPWEAFRSKVTSAFLLRERERAFAGQPTPDCRQGTCSGCGACPGESGAGARPQTGAAEEVSAPPSCSAAETATALSPPGAAEAASALPLSESAEAPPPDEPGRPLDPAPACGEVDEETPPVRYRFMYRKSGRARFLSHREVTNTFCRALRRSVLPLRFSAGFHPHPRLSLGPALAVGMEGEAEFFDAEFTRDGKITFRLLQGLLPAGIEMTGSAGPFTRGEGRIPEESVCDYVIDLCAVESLPETELVCYLPGGEPGAVDATVGSPGQDAAGAPHGPDEAPGRSMPDAGDEAPEPHGLDEAPEPRLPGEGFGPDGAAGWLARRWAELFASGAPLRDRKGRERGVGGCSLIEAGRAGAVGLRIDAAAGASPTPADLLAAVLPRRLAALAIVTRTGIFYRRDEILLGPLDLITGIM